ncbi:MAG TPA: hypothetical protein PLR43_02550, partial [Syntrophales bacterium]|nr:hypothetical protein [Syntrophales bacterium]
GGLDSREQSWEIIVDRIEPDEEHGKLPLLLPFLSHFAADLSIEPTESQQKPMISGRRPGTGRRCFFPMIPVRRVF